MTGSHACSGRRLRVGRSPRCRRDLDPRAGTAPAPRAAPQRGRQSPAVIPGQLGDQRRVINLPAVVRVISIQPGFPRIGRVGVGQPERTAGSNRVRVADITQEPVPGLAAADRAAHRIMPGLSGDGILAPSAQPAHVPRQPSPPPRLTATVTATAATHGQQQRPATAHNARTICANLGYVRPEKRKVAVQLACN